jgi:hypothetical protein
MISAEDVRGLYAQRKNDRQAIIGQMTQVRDLYNADLAVPLPELDSNEKPAVTNLLKQGIDGTAQRITSTMPDVYFPAAKPGQTRSEQQAQVARRAVLGWWQRNDMNNIMARRARHFLGYSISPVVLRPDRTLRHARWEVRDPLTCYPAPSLLDNMTPANVIFAFTRGVDWLLRNHPIAAGALYLNNRDDKITVLEYLDETETVLVALGQPKDPYDTSSHGAAFVELMRAPNLANICPAVIPNRISLDRSAGQFDGLIPMYYKQAKLDALEYIAIEQGVFPRTWLVARQGEVPEVKVVADGRKGIIGVVKGGALQDETLNPGYKTTQAIDRLAGEQRMEGNVPAEMQGVSGQNIRTGRRGDEVLANGIDFGIQEAQKIFEVSLREENRRAVAISKAWFGSEKQTFYVAWRGATGPLEYTPNETFVVDHNVVKYSMAGSDLNNQVVRMGQKLGAGVISKKSYRAADPEIEDPEFEEHQISAEQAITAFEQGIAQQISTGQIPPADAAEYVRLITIKGLRPIDAFLQVQEEAQKRQATAGPPGTSEGPVEPGVPEAMPGISPGSEAGVPIQAPPTAIDNLRSIMLNAGGARNAMRAGAV